ncbi:MAG: M48 family metallopeptidase [Isosphaeraceae bacterium]
MFLFWIASVLVASASAREGASGARGDDRRDTIAGSSLSYDRAELDPLPVPEPSAKAVRYYRSGRSLWAFGRFWDLAVPLALLFTGVSARLRDVARRVGRSWFLSVGVYFVLFSLVVYVADLPLRYYSGFVRPHEYGLSDQEFGKWLGDSLKMLCVSLVGGLVFGWVPFFVIARAPRVWWLATGLLTVPFIAFVTLIAPVWIDPLFNEYGPMKDKALEGKILALAERAGISGSRVFEVNKSVDTKTANAYVKGLFGSKRIVLWDTLLKTFDEREVIVVMAHEMGHYVLNHIPWSIAFSSIITTASLFWTDRAGRRLIARYRGRFGFDSLSDVAATPLLLVLIGVSSLALAPIVLAYNRHHEHEADRFALDLTRMNRSGARAFIDLQRENLGVPHADLFDKLWRSTHPSAAERIAFCNTYHPWVEESPRKPGAR